MKTKTKRLFRGTVRGWPSRQLRPNGAVSRSPGHFAALNHSVLEPTPSLVKAAGRLSDVNAWDIGATFDVVSANRDVLPQNAAVGE